MPVIDRYLAAEWLKAFLLALSATLALLLLENVQNELNDFLRWDAPTYQLLMFYGWYSLTLLPLLIPASIFIATLFSLGNLHRNHEITALRAAGLGLFRLTRTLWLSVLTLTLLLFWLNAELVPNATEATRELRHHWRVQAEAQSSGRGTAGMVSPLGFQNALDGRLWFMNRFSRYTNEGFGVAVQVYDRKARLTQRYLAREAYYDEVTHHWVFREVRVRQYDPVTGQAIRETFDDVREEPRWKEAPSLMLALAEDPDRLSLYELQALLHTFPDSDAPTLRPYALRYQLRLAQPVNCLVVLALAIPFAISGVRTNPMIGVSKAGILFAGYFMLSGVVSLLGEQGHMSLTAAVWLPVGSIALLSLFFYRRLF